MANDDLTPPHWGAEPATPALDEAAMRTRAADVVNRRKTVLEVGTELSDRILALPLTATPEQRLAEALALPEIKAMREALKPLAAIADAFDANELDAEARKFWGQSGVNTTPHDQIELYAGRGGKELLTLADAMKARATLRAVEGK